MNVQSLLISGLVGIQAVFATNSTQQEKIENSWDIVIHETSRPAAPLDYYLTGFVLRPFGLDRYLGWEWGPNMAKFAQLVNDSKESKNIRSKAFRLVDEQSLNERSLKSLEMAHDKLLIWSAENGHLKLVKFLIDNGKHDSIEMESAILAASSEGHYDVIECLMSKADLPDIYNGAAIRLAVKRGDEKMALLMAEQNKFSLSLSLFNDYIYLMAVEKDMINLVKSISLH